MVYFCTENTKTNVVSYPNTYVSIMSGQEAYFDGSFTYLYPTSKIKNGLFFETLKAGH